MLAHWWGLPKMQRVVVGDCQRRVAESFGGDEQLLDVAGPRRDE